MAEVCQRWHTAFTAVTTATASATPAQAVPVQGRTAAQLKLDKPEKYEGNARELQNWLSTYRSIARYAGSSMTESR